MRTPRKEEIYKMTPYEFGALVVKAQEELESGEPIDNAGELELLTLAGGFGSAYYYVLLDNGISTLSEFVKERKSNKNLLKQIAHEAMTLAYPTYYENKKEVE